MLKLAASIVIPCIALIRVASYPLLSPLRALAFKVLSEASFVLFCVEARRSDLTKPALTSADWFLKRTAVTAHEFGLKSKSRALFIKPLAGLKFTMEYVNIDLADAKRVECLRLTKK